tara:strand:- start:768 stop:1019 length:252 start_codon:yes stop_codon:yes gene_type:complete
MTNTTQTRDDIMAKWNRLSWFTDCVTNDRLCHDDITAMLARIHQAEAALAIIAKVRVHGTPDRTSAAQVEAIVGIAAAALETR